MEREGIDIVIDGEYLRADKTTLGGDNGGAVAYILALLDDEGTISHPPIESAGGVATLSDDYPAWEYRQISPLRDTMIETYVEMYGRKPQICAIHAGLECGIWTPQVKHTAH